MQHTHLLQISWLEQGWIDVPVAGIVALWHCGVVRQKCLLIWLKLAEIALQICKRRQACEHVLLQLHTCGCIKHVLLGFVLLQHVKVAER